MHPEISPCTLPIYSNNKWLKKRAHIGCTPPKIVHPAVEMCTPGAECILNFGQCNMPLLYVSRISRREVSMGGVTVRGAVGEEVPGLWEGISSNERAQRPSHRAQRPCGTTSEWHIVWRRFGDVKNLLSLFTLYYQLFYPHI